MAASPSGADSVWFIAPNGDGWTILCTYGDYSGSGYSVAMQDLYVVQVWQTPMPWPLGYAVHTWFVVSYKDQTDRFEVWATLGSFTGSALVQNATAPYVGFRTSFFDSALNPRKIGVATKVSEVSGIVGSEAHELYQSVYCSMAEYPFKLRYRMWPGPNSNTYVQWVLAKHPNIDIVLPWNAFGKKYRS